MRYYRVNYSNLRFRELARLCHPIPPLALLFWLPCKLGFFPWSTGFAPRVDSSTELLIDEEDLPEPAKTSGLESVSEAIALGFEDPFFECARVLGTTTTTIVFASCLHSNGRYSFQSKCGFSGRGKVSWAGFYSFFKDGHMLASNNSRLTVNERPSQEVFHYPGRSISALFDLHQETLAKQSRAPLLVNSQADLLREYLMASERQHDYLVARGLLEETPQLAERRVR